MSKVVASAISLAVGFFVLAGLVCFGGLFEQTGGGAPRGWDFLLGFVLLGFGVLFSISSFAVISEISQASPEGS